MKMAQGGCWPGRAAANLARPIAGHVGQQQQAQPRLNFISPPLSVTVSTPPNAAATVHRRDKYSRKLAALVSASQHSSACCPKHDGREEDAQVRRGQSPPCATRWPTKLLTLRIDEAHHQPKRLPPVRFKSRPDAASTGSQSNRKKNQIANEAKQKKPKDDQVIREMYEFQK